MHTEADTKAMDSLKDAACIKDQVVKIASVHKDLGDMTQGLAKELQSIKDEMNRMQSKIDSELGSKLQALETTANSIRKRPIDCPASSVQRNAFRQQHRFGYEQQPRHTSQTFAGLDTKALCLVIVLLIVIGPGWPFIQSAYGELIVSLYGDQGGSYE
jgi:hypothetical protein